jgi:hypothetical protein
MAIETLANHLGVDALEYPLKKSEVMASRKNYLIRSCERSIVMIPVSCSRKRSPEDLPRR